MIKRLFLSSLTMALSVPVFASEPVKEENIERISVTGTRLKGIDSEISSPVTVITREDIDASGATRLADVLRSSTVNTYGSRRESTGGTTQGQATLNLRGLGEQRTLILINGRRIANSAAIPDAQNINLIPLSAIERVEILKDGASSIYGADAVGGVVNIILRKNIDSHHISMARTQASIKGGDENYFSLYGGFTNNFGNITYSAEHQKKSPIFARDFTLSNEGLSRYGYPGSYRINSLHPETGQSMTKTLADSRCPQKLNQDEFPQSKVEGDYCKYNFANFAQLLPSSQSYSAMIDGQWQYEREVSIFAHLDLSTNKTVGSGAPTPSAGGSVFLPTMLANNPNNPTQDQTIAFDTDFDGIDDTFVDGPFDLDIFYRNIYGGLRESMNTDEMLNFYGGISGTLANDMDYEIVASYNSNLSKSLSRGLMRRDLLQAAIDNGSYDIFAVNQATDEALGQSFAIDSAFQAKFENIGSRFILHTNTFVKDGAEHDTVYGMEYVEHDYSSIFQDEFTDNVIDGRSGGGNAEGKREIFSAFAETQYDLSKALQLNFSVRYDHYSDFGSSLNPKLGISYRYSPNIIYRMSVGTGFRAPSLYELFSQASQSFAYVHDSVRCNAAGDLDQDGTKDQDQDVTTLTDNHPCQAVNIETVITGNNKLEAEKSGSLTTGFTYEVANDTRLHMNFYYQYFKNEINLLPNDELIKREGQFGETKRIIRDEQGNLIRLLNSYSNFSGSKTAGLDIEYELSWQTQSYGEFKWSNELSAVLFHDVEIIPGQGFDDVNGNLGNSESRLNTSMSWYIGDWKTLLRFDFTPPTKENNIKLKAATLANLQVRYQINQQANVSFAVLNMLDSEPPNNRALGWPYYMADTLYVQGRTLNVNFSYTFN